MQADHSNKGPTVCSTPTNDQLSVSSMFGNPAPNDLSGAANDRWHAQSHLPSTTGPAYRFMLTSPLTIRPHKRILGGEVQNPVGEQGHRPLQPGSQICREDRIAEMTLVSRMKIKTPHHGVWHLLAFLQSGKGQQMIGETLPMDPGRLYQPVVFLGRNNDNGRLSTPQDLLRSVGKRSLYDGTETVFRILQCDHDPLPFLASHLARLIHRHG